MNKCPKCGKKLSILYVKQNCSECGCDLLNFEREKMLEKDAERAETEFAWLDSKLVKVKKITKLFSKSK